MRSLLSILLVASGVFLARPSGAETGAPAGLEATRPVLSRNDLLAQRAVTPPEQRNRPEAHVPREARRRNPVVAGLLSAAVPGAGQFYNGSRAGYLFVGVEAAAWLARFSLRDTGLNKKDQYRAYAGDPSQAGSHWTWARYRDPAFEDCPPGGHSDNDGNDSLLVDMYRNDRDSYFEAIATQKSYACGWDSPASLNVYRDLRSDSDRFMSRARTATMIVFVNHLVSAVHAARGAAKHNARLKDHARLDVRWSFDPLHDSASLTLSRRF